MRKPVKSTLRSPFLRRLVLDAKAGLPKEFPGNLPFLNSGNFEIAFTTPVTILVGENATGKSTLLEAIADHCGFHAAGGNRDYLYHGPEASRSLLASYLKCSWLPKIGYGFFFRADSYINTVQFIEQLKKEDPRARPYYGTRDLDHMSHGESFLALFENKLQTYQQAIFLLDEPESALSPQRQLILMRLIDRWSRSGRAQIILATHAPLLMALPGATLLYFDPDGVREINFRATPHFRTLAEFFADPEAMVAAALAESDTES